MNKLEELRKQWGKTPMDEGEDAVLYQWMCEVEKQLEDINARSLVIRDNPVDAMNDMVAVAYGTGVEYKPLKEYHEASEASGECDEIAKGHNPDKLTVAQVGEGYRLLDKDEVIGHKNLPAIKEIECYTEEGQWEGGYTGSTKNYTYRTKLTRAELREARGLDVSEPTYKVGDWVKIQEDLVFDGEDYHRAIEDLAGKEVQINCTDDFESKDEEPIPQTWENLRPDWRDIWYVCGSEVSRIQGFNSCKHNIRIAGEWIKFTSFIKVFAPEDGDPLFVRKEEG